MKLLKEDVRNIGEWKIPIPYPRRPGFSLWLSWKASQIMFNVPKSSLNHTCIMWYYTWVFFMCVGGRGGNCLGVRNKTRQVNPRVAFVFLSPSFVLWFFFPYFSPLILRLIYRHIVFLQKSSLKAILHTGPRWLFQNSTVQALYDSLGRQLLLCTKQVTNPPWVCMEPWKQRGFWYYWYELIFGTMYEYSRKIPQF